MKDKQPLKAGNFNCGRNVLPISKSGGQNEHSLGEFNKFAEADSVVLYSLMQAFPLPTKFLQALADFEVWSNINYDTFAKNSVKDDEICVHKRN